MSTITFNDDLAARKRDRNLPRETLTHEQANTATLLQQLQPQLDAKDKPAKKQANALRSRMFAIAEQLSQLDHQDTEDEAKAPDSRWIRECPKFFGRTMKSFVNTDNRWDVFVLVQVMHGLLPEIFSSMFPDDFHAKEFLTAILRVVGARNGRAHLQSRFIESDALTAMSQMILVLRL